MYKTTKVIKRNKKKDNEREYTISRKIRLTPVGDSEEINRIYKYIRDNMYYQNKAYNQLVSAVYAAQINGNSNDEIKEIYKRASRNPKRDNPHYSYFDFTEFENMPEGIPITNTVSHRVKADMSTATSNGLFKGSISLQNKKLNAPLMIRNDKFWFYHNYESDEEFQNHLYKLDFTIFMQFPKNILFKVDFGSPHKSGFLRSEFEQIFSGEYFIGDSSIQLVKEKKKKICNDNEKKETTKIILNLSLTIPKEKRELDENKVVGVDVGVAIPAVCALNDNKYSRQFLGSKDDLLRVRTQLQHQRQQLQRSLKFNSGGHGMKKKLKPLERLKARERNFVRTYNHKISKRVVDFALKNNAKYINIENLKGIDTSQFILRNWSYYELQQFITYKAAKFGIEVRKINPYHTSQVCSCCGHYEPGQRKRQAEFICKNPECENYGKVINADFNAARNIAMSTEFTNDEDNGKKKKTSRKKKVNNNETVECI